MTKIVFLEVDQEDEPFIREKYPDCVILSTNIQDEAALAECQDADVISCFIYSKFDAATLEKLPNLKLLCSRSVGYDHIDLQATSKADVKVCNVPDYGAYVIAEHVFALLLSTLRHIPEADDRVEEGEFDYKGLRGVALHGKTIGVVGTGKIGSRVAMIARGFGMNVRAVDRCRTMELVELLQVKYSTIDELFRESDIISLHLPATKETEHLINAESLATMKDGVIIVNTARGALIDSVALLDALKSGQVSYALLDVLEHEKNYEQNKELIDHPRVVTTPHIAFYADDSMRNMYIDAFASITQWQNDEEPLHLVQPPEIICDLPSVSSSKS